MPQIRLFATHSAVAAVRAMSPAVRDRVIAAVPGFELLGDGLQVSWGSLDAHMGILASARRVLGAEAFRVFHRDLMLAYLDKPLLKGLFESITRLLGVSPQSLVKWSPRAWDALFRDCGTFAVDRTSSSDAELVLDGFVPEHADLFVESLAGSLDALLVLTKRQGRVMVRDEDPARGYARFRIEWE